MSWPSCSDDADPALAADEVAFTRLQVQTTNQPSSRAPLDVDLNAEKLGELLGWAPTCDRLLAVLCDLQHGLARAVTTRDVPMERGTDCVRFVLTPSHG